MKDLRERGVYTLPDGEEFVASIARGGGFALFNPQIWKRYGVPDYEVDPLGRVTQLGQSTRWRVDDLVDTGRTAE
ncbi:MAG TPA: hypothetical protein VE360_05270 [Pyrinomonadaceae bacterium]|nr:hypothetical protein [Pyrinomonadaceae bacterium]